MKKKDILLYGIILALAINLLANMIFHHLPREIDEPIYWIVTVVLVAICIFILITCNERKITDTVDDQSSAKQEIIADNGTVEDADQDIKGQGTQKMEARNKGKLKGVRQRRE